MATVSDFIEYCIHVLEKDFGKMSGEIITQTSKNKDLNENSTIEDLNQFIGSLESNIVIFLGKNEATKIGYLLRKKVSEMDASLTENIINEKEMSPTIIEEEIMKSGSIDTNLSDIINEKEMSPTIIEEEIMKSGSIDTNLSDIENTNFDKMNFDKMNFDKMNFDKIENTNFDNIENKILVFLESNHKIDDIMKELNIEEEILADNIIDLDSKQLIALVDKDWILTQNGKELLQNGRKEILKKLKIDFLHGVINKEEFLKRRSELERFLRP